MNMKIRTAAGGGLASKKLLAAIAVLAVAFAVFAAIPAIADDSDAAEATEVTTANALVTAVGNANFNVKLGADITLASQLTISKTGTIDFNGKTISSTLTNQSAVVIKSTSEAIEVQLKNGSIDASKLSTDYGTQAVSIGTYNGNDSTAIETVKLIDMDIKSKTYGIGVFGKTTLKNVAFDKVTENVQIIGGSVEANWPAISTNGLHGGELISIQNVALKSTSEAAIFAPSNGKFIIDECTIEGVSGIDQRAGSVSVTNSTIKYNGPAEEKTNSDGPVAFGVGISVMPVSGYSTVGTTMDVGDGVKFVKGENANDQIFVSAYDYKTTSYDSAKTAAGTVPADVLVTYDGFKVQYAKDASNATATVIGLGDKGANLAVGDVAAVTIVKDSTIGNSNISEKATLTVSDKATMTVAGKLTGAVAGTGKVAVEAGADITGATFAATVETEIDPAAMSDMVVGGDSVTEKTVFGSTQVVTVSKEAGYWNLVAGADITINGKLVVPEGTTLTVQAGATLTFGTQAVVEIEGTLIVEDAIENSDGTEAGKGIITQNGGTVTVYGTAQIAGTYTAAAGKFIAEQDSVVTVEAAGVLASKNIVVKASANFKVEGAVTSEDQTDASVIYNYGVVVFDSQKASKSVDVKMMADGATVIVTNFTVASKDTALTITDAGMVVAEKDKTQYIIGATIDNKQFGAENKVVLQPTSTATSDFSNLNVTISGITVVEKLTSKAKTSSSTYAVVGDKTYSNTMEIFGNVSTSTVKVTVADDDTTTTEAAETPEQYGITLTAGHGITVPANETGTSLAVGLNVILTNASGELTIEGAVDATAKKATSSSDKDASFVNEGTVTVVKDGSIKTTAALANTVNATHYTTGTEKINNYVEIDAALATVNAAGNEIKTLTVLGKQTVDATTIVPAKVTVTLKDDTQLYIGAKAGADVTLTVDKDAALKGTGTVYVNGTLHANDKTKLTVSKDKIISDVMSEETNDGKLVRNGWIEYTNIVAALNGAEAGETITVSKIATVGGKQQYVTIASDISVKEGVTLVVKDGVAPILLNNGVTFTVAGTLQTAQPVYAEEKFDVKASNVTGDKSSAIIVTGTMKAAKTLYGAGETTEDGAYANTESGAPIAGAYYDIKDYQVISTLEIAIQNIKDVESVITVNGKVSVGDITFSGNDDYKTIVIGSNLDKIPTLFQATSLTLADGAQLAIKNVANTGSFTGTVVVGDAAVDMIGATSSVITDDNAPASIAIVKESEGKLVLTGEIVINDKGDKLAVSKGTVYMDGGFTVDSIADDTSGVFSVASGAVLEPVAEKSTGTIDALTVEGTLNVPNGTTVNVTVLNVDGAVVVAPATSTAGAGSLSAATMYVGIDASDITKTKTGAAASVSGPFTLGTAYIADGAVLDDAALEQLSKDNVKKLAFNVQGKLWFTVYSADGNAKVTANKAPLTDAILAGWSETDGGKAIVDETADNKPVMYEFTVDGTYEALYAVVNTYIYSVSVIADTGIENIAIDGNLISGETLVAAGSHTVTYSLKNGYSGTATMTVNGEKQSGLTFTTSGTSDADRTVKIQLTGITASGYVQPTEPAQDDKDDGLSLTDILLIILVVLIVVMAIIVALRLMRS